MISIKRITKQKGQHRTIAYNDQVFAATNSNGTGPQVPTQLNLTICNKSDNVYDYTVQLDEPTAIELYHFLAARVKLQNGAYRLFDIKEGQ